MRINVGSFDRWLRVVVGLGIVSLAFWGPRTPWAWLGLVPLATGVLRRCPSYSLLGISTCGGSMKGPE